MRRRTLLNNAEISTPLPPFPDGSNAEVGDVVVADKFTQQLYIISYSEYESGQYMDSSIYKDIGIVVIPASHGVLKNGDGTKNHCGIISMVPMSSTTSLSGEQSTTASGLCYGFNSSDITGQTDGLGRYDSITNGLTNYTVGNCVSPTDPTGLTTPTSNPGLPTQTAYGGNANWKSYASSNGYAPSPFLSATYNTGKFNSAYSSTENSNYNAFSDFGGIINTKILTDLSTKYTWKNSNIISNIGNYSHSPAACACANYRTIGTKAFVNCTTEELYEGVGFWYFPAAGEFAYILPNLMNIYHYGQDLHSTLTGKDFLLDTTGGGYNTSTEYSGRYNRRIGTGDGNLYYNSKTYDGFIWAFMQL